jgi:hypothetical protein
MQHDGNTSPHNSPPDGGDKFFLQCLVMSLLCARFKKCQFSRASSETILAQLLRCIFSNLTLSELNPCAQGSLQKFFTSDFVSWTMHFVNTCVKNQQMQQLFIQFITYLWYLLHVAALHCHHQGAFLVPYERCSIEEQSIEYCGWVCCVWWQYTSACSSIEHLSEGTRNAPWGWQCNAETCRSYHT